MDLVKAITMALFLILLLAVLTTISMIAFPVMLFLALILLCWFVIKICQEEEPPDD